MDFQIVGNAQYPKGGLLFLKNLDIRTSIFISLNVKKGNFFQNPNFGNELYKVTKVTESNINLAKQYVQQCLAWLIQTGRAKSIDVLVEQDSTDIYRLDIKVSATQPDGLIITYQQYRPVGLGARSDYYIQDGSLVSA